jgi:hypothetical protein
MTEILFFTFSLLLNIFTYLIQSFKILLIQQLNFYKIAHYYVIFVQWIMVVLNVELQLIW